MNTTNVIVIAVITIVIGLAILKIVRDKKKGIKCTGCSSCPYSDGNGNCSGNVH